MADLDFSTSMVLVAVSMFSALSALFLGGIIVAKHSTGAPEGGGISDLVERTLFVFRGQTLIEATPAALLFAGAPVNHGTIWQTLCKRLKALCPEVETSLATLPTDGTPVKLCALRPAQNERIMAWRRGRMTFVEVLADPATSPLQPQDTPAVSLRDLADAAPILTWSQDDAGAVIWANRPYLNLAARFGAPSLAEGPPYPTLFRTEPGRPISGRCSIQLPGEATPLWFEVVTYDTGKGAVLYYAIHADPLVKAEGALRNFVQTLTKTFAHLPTGLAIFDRERQLALFNPALSDMTTLEPEWLTARPSLYAFLDRLRENRHLPEPKDYKSWRHRIAELEKAAEQGTYEENWALPSGQTYKVTGRPHPEGAVAFLFEDITSEVLLQRQFRSELALGQSVLDSEPDAIAVFSAGEELVMSNDAYTTLWGIDPDQMLARITLGEARQHWRAGCSPPDASQPSILDNDTGNSRLARIECMTTLSGHRLMLRISPLAQGATLYRFSVHAGARSRATGEAAEKILAEA